MFTYHEPLSSITETFSPGSQLKYIIILLLLIIIYDYNYNYNYNIIKTNNYYCYYYKKIVFIIFKINIIYIYMNNNYHGNPYFSDQQSDFASSANITNNDIAIAI